MKKEMKLFQLAWPIFVSNILGILLGFIDVFVLSKVSDLAASAISAACQITSICSLVFSVVCGATGILVAQYLGKGDREKASEITALCIVTNVAMGVVISAVVLIFHDQFLYLLGAKEELFSMASAYIAILGWGIVLDAVLVLGLFGMPRLEVRGAAYATIITKVICSLLLSFVFFTKVESVSIFKKVAQARLEDVKAIFKLGIPSVFDSVNYSITQLIITGIILHSLGETDIIARTYLMNIAAFSNYLQVRLHRQHRLWSGMKLAEVITRKQIGTVCTG